MKSILLYIFILIISISANGQNIGINSSGATPNSSAMLDVSSTSKGMLIPRMTTFQRNAINSPALGLLIFNTSTKSFWYHDSTGWKELLFDKVSSLYDVDNNTRIQVEETTNEDIIRFDVAGTEVLAMKENSNGLMMMEIGNAGRNIFLGKDAGKETNVNSFQGYGNTFIGDRAGRDNLSGSYNSCFGPSAGSKLVDGANNTYLGTSSGINNSVGDKNVAVGSNAGGNQTSGDQNVYLGTSAGSQKTGGDSNVLIGYQAGRITFDGSGNICIGTNAAGSGAGTINNRLYIENSSSTTPLIYGEFDNDFLKCNGDFSASGSVGIGINNPDDALHIYESSADVSAKIEAGNSKLSSLKLFEQSDFGYELQYDGDSDRLNLWSRNFSGNEDIRQTWEKNGQIGMGVENPTALLHLKQLSGDEVLMLENNSATNTWAFEFGVNDLHMEYNGTKVGYFDDATGNYTATSDRRFKKDIVYINEKILDKVVQLAPARYRLTHAPSNSQKATGFIAQEVQALFPEIVATKEDGTLGIHYPDFGVLAIKAIQEQQEIIENQENYIARLEKQQTLLQEQMENVMNRLASIEAGSASN